MAASFFDAEFFSENRRRLRELFGGSAPIIIPANGLLQRNSDQAFPFRQDSNFWYLTGINEPDLVLVMDRDEEYLIVPVRNDIRTYFDGAIESESLQRRSGITTLLDDTAGWKRLSTRIKRLKRVATVPAPPPFAEHFEFYTNPARRVLSDKLLAIKKDLELLDIRQHFITARMIKQEPELTALRASVDLTVGAFRDLSDALPRMHYEYEAEAFLHAAFRSKGARPGYDSIVGGGSNGCTLHYGRNDEALKAGELLLIDAGAEVEYYGADITRVFARGGVSKRQQALLDAVIAAQDYGLSLIKPGATIRENERLMETFIGERLCELGLIKTVEREAVRKYYPHALSHHLGLDLHDMADYDAPLAPDMVLTVEPGIYVPEEGIGVRIEDDVRVTAEGYEVLSKELPRLL